MDTRTFLTTLFGEAEGFLFISTKDEKGALTQHKSYKYPVNLPQIENYCSLRTDEDVYFSPMLYSLPRRASATVSSTPVVYCDTDLFDINGFLVPPTVNIRTSTDPVKMHSYWVLDRNDYTPQEVSTVARAICLAHASKVNGKQAGTDPSGWDLTQLLRLPYSVNTKHEPPQLVTVDTDSFTGNIYTLEELADAYDPANLDTLPMPLDSPLPDELPSSADVLRKVVSIPKLQDLYSKVPYGDWSDTIYLLCSEMFREGFTAEEVVVVAWNSESNKYKRDGRPMEDLWRYDVLKSQADPANRPRTRVEEVASDGLVRPAPRPRDEGEVSGAIEAALFRPGEIEQLSRTFVDEYVDWASTKTDAPAPYHVAGAFTILSAIFGEWGVAFPQFGDLRLGLFFVIMGETTDTRKTTARNLMKKLLRMTQIGDYEYILTGDVTPETLLDVLSERPHQSSLYDRDEFQALVSDVKNKAYMKSFFETLNEMYDGWARGRMRKDKRTKDTPVNFVQYAMGIRSQIQENLEESDFLSGYLPRNIFVRGEAPPRTRENSRLKQGDPESAGIDRVLTGLVQTLCDGRSFWAAKVGDRAYPHRVLFDDDAWARWDDFKWELRQYVEKREKAHLLIPSVERLSFNVLKAATLFAMADRRERGNMSDILNAIYFGAQWVEDLIIVAEGVSESMYQRSLNNVTDYIIEQGGLVTYAALLKWSAGQGIIKKDLQLLVEHLSEDGTLEIVDDGHQRRSLRLRNVY